MAPNLQHVPHVTAQLSGVKLVTRKDVEYQRPQEQQSSDDYWEWPASSKRDVLSTDRTVEHLVAHVEPENWTTHASSDDYWAENAPAVPANYWDEQDHVATARDDYWNTNATASQETKEQHKAATTINNTSINPSLNSAYWAERRVYPHRENDDYWRDSRPSTSADGDYWTWKADAKSDSDDYWSW